MKEKQVIEAEVRVCPFRGIALFVTTDIGGLDRRFLDKTLHSWIYSYMRFSESGFALNASSSHETMGSPRPKLLIWTAVKLAATTARIAKTEFGFLQI